MVVSHQRVRLIFVDGVHPMQTSKMRKLKPFHTAISLTACLVASVTITTVLLSSQPLRLGRSKLSLPAEFSSYRKWTALHSSPYAVPLDLIFDAWHQLRPTGLGHVKSMAPTLRTSFRFTGIRWRCKLLDLKLGTS